MKEPSAPRLRKRCSRKLKLVCSFGGSFRPRPPSGVLRYTGGETRVVSFDRGIGLSGLRSKIADLWPHLPSFSVAFQLRLSNGAARSLVPVASDADVARMVDAYDKMDAYGTGTFRCRLWVFVFVEERFEHGGLIATDASECSKNGLEIDSQFGISVKELARSELGRLSRDRINRVNALDHQSPICSRLRSERFRSSVNPHPLTPRDQNLTVESSSYMLRSGNRISSGCSVNSVNEPKQQSDSGAIFTGFGGEKVEGLLLSHVNRENIVPSTTNDHHSSANMEPTKSPESRANVIHSVAKSFLTHKRNGDILKNGESAKMACPGVYSLPREGSMRIVSSCLNDRDPDLYCQSNEMKLPIDQQGKINLLKGAGGAGLSSNQNGTASPMDSSFCHLLLPSSEACSTEMPDGQIKSEAKLIELMELSVATPFDDTNGVRSDSHSPAIPGTGKTSSVVAEESVIKESCKHSKALRGIPTDLPASYSNLVTTALQAIKASDLEYLKELGAGTYGTVYHGKWKGSDVAIKKLRPSCFTGGSTDKDRLVADFWKEAHILGQLHHPNIVAFYGVVTDGPVTNLATVTEYMVNGSLKQVLNRKDRTIDRRKRVIIARDAAFGMEYLHGKNIVHFDLKSHNFLVNMRDPLRPVCKIGDLGLSKIKQRTLVSGGVRGTIPWMAPELFSSEKNNMVTEKIDVYSFGIVMWELLTGEEPYANMRSQDIIAGTVKGSLRPEIPTWCDPTWRSLMERCWSSDPNSRPSFVEVAKELCAMSATMNIK